MKKSLALFVILISAGIFNRSYSQNSLLDSLTSIDEIHYINKPLDSIIAKLPSSYEFMKINSLKYYKARFVTIMYPNRIWINLHVRDFAFMNPIDSNRVWNINLMRKEKLYGIVIYNGIHCVKNCDLY